MEETEIKHIVIATPNPEKALYIVSKDALLYDEIELRYTDKYAPTTEYLLRILRKAFGWMEIDRGTKDVLNTRCIHAVNGICREPVLSKNELIKCTELVRKKCKKYKPRYTTPMQVNYVIIEKAGGIRNM